MELNYHNFFTLPEGAQLTHTICTTMSLSAEEQLRILACAHGLKEIVLKDKSQTALIESDIGNFWFFYDCDKSDADAPALQGYERLAAALHRMRIPVTKQGGIFHPKLILIRYKDKDNTARYRLQVSSRNLTTPEVFEVGAQLIGVKCEDQCNHNVAALIGWLIDFLPEECCETEKQHFKGIFDELTGIDFTLPGMPQHDVCVTVSGVGAGQDKQLVTLWEGEYNAPQKSLYILSPDYETSQGQIDHHRIYAPAEMDTHAKLYFHPEPKNGGTVWLGSCNSSDAAMNGENVECMVRISNTGDMLTVGTDDYSFNVFGTPCERITKARKYTGDKKYGLIARLNQWIACLHFEGEDKKKRSDNRRVTVALKKISEPSLVQGDQILLLPLGMQEKTNVGNDKWKNYDAEEKKYTFIGRKAEQPNGLLRIRLMNDGQHVEQYVCFDLNAMRTGEGADRYSSFVETNWLERLMDARDKDVLDIIDSGDKDAFYVEEEKCLFEESYQAAVKGNTITEVQRGYLAELHDIYESIYCSYGAD